MAISNKMLEILFENMSRVANTFEIISVDAVNRILKVTMDDEEPVTLVWNDEYEDWIEE